MKKTVWTIVGMLVLGAIVWGVYLAGRPGSLNAFATCIKDAEATFYGAFWCSHCQAEKARFGRSAKLLPYVECSTPDGKGQTQVCIDKNITSYPTWEFADGSRIVGEAGLEKLAEKTACTLPE